MILQDIEQKSVVLLGFGVEGQATYEFLRSRFPGKHLSIADRHSIKDLDIATRTSTLFEHDEQLTLHCGEAYLESIGDYEVIVKTPGIRMNTSALGEARERGAQVTSHMEIFFELIDRRRIIGVTGTKGKSTTTALICKLARGGGLDAIPGGNIGEPPLLRLDEATQGTIFVLELSSYQLEPLRRSPHIAVLLNIVPEHLDYHSNFGDYASAKENITRFQGESDLLVYNADYDLPVEIASRTLARSVPFSIKRELEHGCFFDGDWVIFADGETRIPILNKTDIPLIGRFNVQNVCAAVGAAVTTGVSAETMAASVRGFKPLPHRLEYIGQHRGVRFYNDSISTVPESASSALEALGDDVQTIILGGYDRHLDYSSFARHLLSSNVDTLILFSPTGERIWEAVRRVAGESLRKLNGLAAETMEEAVRLAFKHTAGGRICLLSPAAPSYGKFKDFRERGDKFRTCVEEIASE